MATKNAEDWRPVDGDIADFQNEARKEGLFTDIQFVIGEGESSQTFSAHKAILACGSPVFEKMFYGAISEQGSVINIEDDDPEAFEMLLSYLYGNGKCVQISSFIRAWKYYVIGDKYLVPGIQTIVTQFISSTPMNEDNFWDIIESDIFSCQILVDKIISFLQVNASNILQAEKFLNMPESLINIILQMDKLNITEYKLLTCVTNWAYHYIGSDTNSNDLLKYFQHIRFALLTTDDFLTFIALFPSAVDPQNSLDILKYLHDKSTYKLPDWCTTINGVRNAPFQQILYSAAPNFRGNRYARRSYSHGW